MSWQRCQAAILGLDGSVKGISPDFTISDAEAKKRTAAFDGDQNAIYANGIFLEGTKLHVLHTSGDNVKGNYGATGVIDFKTKQFVIVGYHDQTRRANNATMPSNI
ncbi:hypothetical protein BGX29_008011 [Mortierella sp. GBA35]|nr:hypothetical protein BGX29_008011 [Mortierella sp. GBA35]